MEGKKIILFSGGHSSAIAAIECVRKYGKENCMLLNHDVSSKVEDEDIKRFKRDVANYLDVPMIHVNNPEYETLTPIQVALKQGIFAPKGNRSSTVCTYHLKTKPFYDWLAKEYPVKKGEHRGDVEFIYGFDGKETSRMSRRVDKMYDMGYYVDFPLAWKHRTIFATEEVGIKRPRNYTAEVGGFRHANCYGCLKAGRQHWYAVYVLRPDIFYEAMDAEKQIGYTIMKDVSMEQLETLFEKMKQCGVKPDDVSCAGLFWKRAREKMSGQISLFDCDLSIYGLLNAGTPC